MKRIAVLTLLILGGLTASAQIQYPYIVLVSADPTGNNCSGPQLQTLANGNVYSCANGVFALVGGSGSPAFSTLTSGTNTSAAMVVGSGASLATSGTGTIAATSLAGGSTITGTPAASVAAIQSSPTLFTGGTGTTTFPYLMLQPSGATAETGWSTSGTFLGINSASGFSGLFMDFHLNNGTSVFAVSSAGAETISGGFAALTVTGGKYLTNANCAVNSASPAACGSAAAGAVVIPTTTTSYTVNTTAVTAASRIMLFPMSFAGNLPSSPTCVAPAVTSAVTISAISAATSFTIALPSTSGQTCWQYFIVD